jgi:5'-methylthioadenosine phosphorylase
MLPIPIVAIIGGSGLYNMPMLQNMSIVALDTPFGKPSSPITIGYLSGKPVAFLSRHGKGHHISPTEVNYRANIYALKLLGVNRVVSISACGSLREDYAPGSIVVPDQIFDATHNRVRTFFEDGLVAHISVADPFCSNLSDFVHKSVVSSGATVHKGGTLITIEGPRFSTRAESNTYRTWGMSLIGMTACPEAFLAREAEMCYAIMAHITDFDVWHQNEEPVSVDMVINVLNRNTEIAQKSIEILVSGLPNDRSCDCENTLATALITNPEQITPTTRERVELIIKKYIT